ncbi:MAG: DUF4097 family beta strand repeat-containing protein [Vicinamibacterales bacterium]
MIPRALVLNLVAAGLLAAGAAAQTGNEQITVPLTDPARVVTVKVRLVNGGVTVRGGTGREVVVTTSRSEREVERRRERDQRADGLRRLTQPGGLTVEEEDNTVTIAAPPSGSRGNIAVEVPASSNLVVRTVNGGEVMIEGVTGTIELNSVNGSIRLVDVGGPVVAHAVNGRIVASMRQMPGNSPMSFTSFNGSVDVTLPPASKANLKLRSDRGDVYTDFEVSPIPPPPGADRGRVTDSRGARRERSARADEPPFKIEVDRSIYGTINGGGADLELRTFNGNVYLRRAK